MVTTHQLVTFLHTEITRRFTNWQISRCFVCDFELRAHVKTIKSGFRSVYH